MSGFFSHEFDERGVVKIKTFFDLNLLANEKVWPHCREGMGVDGDEMTQTFIDEGLVMFAPDEGFWLTISDDEIDRRVMKAYEEGRA